MTVTCVIMVSMWYMYNTRISRVTVIYGHASNITRSHKGYIQGTMRQWSDYPCLYMYIRVAVQVLILPVTCTASTIHQGYPISNYVGGKKTQ